MAQTIFYNNQNIGCDCDQDVSCWASFLISPRWEAIGLYRKEWCHLPSEVPVDQWTNELCDEHGNMFGILMYINSDGIATNQRSIIADVIHHSAPNAPPRCHLSCACRNALWRHRVHRGRSSPFVCLAVLILFFVIPFHALTFHDFTLFINSVWFVSIWIWIVCSAYVHPLLMVSRMTSRSAKL